MITAVHERPQHKNCCWRVACRKELREPKEIKVRGEAGSDFGLPAFYFRNAAAEVLLGEWEINEDQIDIFFYFLTLVLKSLLILDLRRTGSDFHFVPGWSHWQLSYIKVWLLCHIFILWL